MIAAQRGQLDRHAGVIGPSRGRHWTVTWAARHAWVLGMLLLAVGLGELPHALAACCAPAGATGFGTAWFVNDFSQYEYAMRQGAQQPDFFNFSSWLVHDPFTAEPNPAAFMFPLYVGIGKLSAAVHLPTGAVEQLVEIAARILLVLALWRFCRAFAKGKHAARWAFGLALFASGFELFSALLGGYSGNWSYELNGFGLLFAAPHVPLAMAATLELARDGLRPRRNGASLRSRLAPTADARPRPTIRLDRPFIRWLAKVASLSAVIALLHPFHAPVLLGAMFVAGLLWWRSHKSAANLVGAIVAGVAALPVLAPTVLTFSFQQFWVTTYTSQNLLPSPAPHELLVDLGPTLLLALFGAFMLRGRIAPFGLVLWLLLALIAMYIPVPYQRRLSFGIDPMVGVLAANALIEASRQLTQRAAALLRLGTVALGASSTVLVLVSVVASGFGNGPLPVYRSTPDLDAAAAWLDTRASSSDIIIADWEASNYLAARTPARVFGGHPVATLHPDQKRFAIATVFAHPSSLTVARSLGAQWLVYGPDEAGMKAPRDPAFESGPVRVYRVS